MNTMSSHRRGRGAALTLLLTAAVTCVGATAAQAAPGFAFTIRTGGSTRVDTAVATSQHLYPSGSTSADVVIVNQWSVVDGLSASFLAGLHNAPILFSDTGSLPSATAAEIKRLHATHVWMVGGPTVLSTGLEQGLSHDYTVTRYYGADRYATAAAVAEAAPYEPERVYLASGTSLADAVTVSPIAWARNYPVLLTKSDLVPDATRDALVKLGTTNRTVVGGTAVITDGTAKALRATGRLAGANRAATAVQVADDAVVTANFTRANAALVGGGNGAAIDALAASSLAGNTGTPILYTVPGAGIGPDTASYLHANRAELVSGSLGFVFGGTTSISDEDVTQANAAAQ